MSTTAAVVFLSVLFPGKGLKQLYDVDSGKTQYSILFNVLLTY